MSIRLAQIGAKRQTTPMFASLVLAGFMASSGTTLAQAQTEAAPPTRHESEAERLHRKGVYCQEAIERPDCAIEMFEGVLDSATIERELVSDALLRLVELYRDQGRTEDLQDALRQYWDAGMKWNSTGHVPYTLRFLPPELTVVVNLDLPRMLQTPLATRLGPDVATGTFSCDPHERADAWDRVQWKRARTIAAREGRSAIEVYDEELGERVERRREYAERREDPDRPSNRTPLFAEATCPVFRALGEEDMRAATRMTGAMYHKDFRRSVGIAVIEGLDAKLQRAVQSGSLKPLGSNRWELVDYDFDGEAVHLAKLDRNELTMARASMMNGIFEASSSRNKRIERELEKLIGGVPKDTSFFMVLTQAAMEHLAFGKMNENKAGFFQTLLPRPNGLQIAGMVGKNLGMFTRMPTDNQVKGRMLVALAERMVEMQADGDPEVERFVRNLDIAEAKDRKALLVTYLLSGRDLELLLYGG